MKRTVRTSAAATAIGTSIRVRRTQAGLSIREVARRAKLSASYLSEIENGHRTPSREKYPQLAAAIPGLSLLTLEIAELTHNYPGRSPGWYRAVVATMQQQDEEVLDEVEEICTANIAEAIKGPSPAGDTGFSSGLLESVRQVLGPNQMSLEAIAGSLLSLGMVNGSGETFRGMIRLLVKKPDFVSDEKGLYRVRDR